MKNVACKKTLKIAVTGNAGSGKSSVCEYLNEKGCELISSDILAREAVAPESESYVKILDHFGKKIVLDNGRLNRKKLRGIIVNDESERLALERIVQPEILKRMRNRMLLADKEGIPVLVVEVPLLFELRLEGEFDVVVVVSVNRETRIKRLMTRDMVARADAEALLNTQMSEKRKIEMADFVINNNDSKQRMIKSVDILIKSFYRKYKKSVESA